MTWFEMDIMRHREMYDKEYDLYYTVCSVLSKQFVAGDERFSRKYGVSHSA
jgi:hypothetical protein